MLLLGNERRTRRLRKLVLPADDVTVDDAILVAGHEAAVAGGARETVNVVDGRRLTAGTCLQHHLARRNVLTTTGAYSRRTEHPTANTYDANTITEPSQVK